jgi:arylsulfatase A-like enzyme
MPSANALLMATYSAFNARDLDSALATMHPEVEWPNGMEDGYIHGRDGVRTYWTRQWKQVDPHVEPQRFTADEKGRMIVEVHQIVRDLAGTVLLDRMVHHVYQLRDGLIGKMEIVEL